MLCHFCSGTITRKPFGLPLDYCERTGHFTTVHSFCDPSCALSYAWRHYGTAAVSSMSMWVQMLAERSGYEHLIRAAPPKERLKCFGGDLTRAKFNELKCIKHVDDEPLFSVPTHNISNDLLRIRSARADIHSTQPLADAFRAALNPQYNSNLPKTLIRSVFGNYSSVFSADVIQLWAQHLSIHFGLVTAGDLGRELTRDEWTSAITHRVPGNVMPIVHDQAVSAIRDAFINAGLSSADAVDAEYDSDDARMDIDEVAGSRFDALMATRGALTKEEKKEAAADEHARRRATRRSRQHAAAKGAGRAPKRSKVSDKDASNKDKPSSAGVLSFFSKKT